MSLSRKLLRKSLTVLFIASSVWMMTGCAHSTNKSVAPPIPANLAQPCPALQPLTGTDGATVTRWITRFTKQYHDCKDKHSAIVESWPR